MCSVPHLIDMMIKILACATFFFHAHRTIGKYTLVVGSNYLGIDFFSFSAKIKKIRSVLCISMYSGSYELRTYSSQFIRCQKLIKMFLSENEIHQFWVMVFQIEKIYTFDHVTVVIQKKGKI